MPQSQSRRAFTEQDIKNMLHHMANEISRKHDSLPLCLVGIRTGGAHLAGRLAKIIANISQRSVLNGALDINLYRDDWSLRHHAPLLQSTEIDFDLHKQNIVLVDDVLYTGRTVRAALDALLDLGRPKRIELAVLIDRGGRELPIAPNYVGSSLSVAPQDRVDVLLSEAGYIDQVQINGQGQTS